MLTFLPGTRTMIDPYRVWEWIDLRLRLPDSIKRCWSMDQELGECWVDHGFLWDICSSYICTDDEIEIPHTETRRSSTVSGDTIILPSPIQIPPRVARPQHYDEPSLTCNAHPRWNCRDQKRIFEKGNGEKGEWGHGDPG